MIEYITDDLKFYSDGSDESDEEKNKIKHHDGFFFNKTANIYVQKIF